MYRLYTVRWYRIRNGKKNIETTFVRSDVSGNAKKDLQWRVAWREGLEPKDIVITSYRRSPKGV